MTNILTPAQAANVLRCATDDALMLQLLPQVDSFIQRATGRDWTADNPISNRAISAAQMLITLWHENPGMMGGDSPLSFGLNAALLMLETDALDYLEYTFDGLDGGGYLALDMRALKGAQVVSLVGITGVSGDQSANFESVLDQDFYIQQTSTSDLSDNQYKLILINAADAI